MSAPAPPAPAEQRRRAQGAEVRAGGAHFRVWAPGHQRVEVLLGDDSAGPPAAHPLAAEADGHWSAFVPGVVAGARYR
ncbi:MAG: malto-oligosyltrehalose trehalohydrolase, partial [Pseudomonadota bacterium]